VLAYLQIVLGSVLRHVPVEADPSAFVLAVRFHLVMAGLLTIHIALLVWLMTRHARQVRPLVGRAWLLGVLLVAQLALGAGTWIVKFSVPAWAQSWLPSSWSRIAIVDGSLLQTHIVTGHVAIGSLILATSLSLALYSLRMLKGSARATSSAMPRLEAAT
jgi:hypothetical protein